MRIVYERAKAFHEQPPPPFLGRREKIHFACTRRTDSSFRRAGLRQSVRRHRHQRIFARLHGSPTKMAPSPNGHRVVLGVVQLGPSPPYFAKSAPRARPNHNHPQPHLETFADEVIEDDALNPRLMIKVAPHVKLGDNYIARVAEYHCRTGKMQQQRDCELELPSSNYPCWERRRYQLHCL